MPLARLTLPQHLPRQHVQGRTGSWCRSTYSQGARGFGRQRQGSSGGLQGPGLAFLIHTQDDDLVRRVQVEPDDVDKLGLKGRALARA